MPFLPSPSLPPSSSSQMQPSRSDSGPYGLNSGHQSDAGAMGYHSGERYSLLGPGDMSEPDAYSSSGGGRSR